MAETAVPTLLTERLVLRPWRGGDRDALAQMHADPKVMEFLPPLAGRTASDMVAARIGAHFVRHGFGLWVVEVPGVTPFAGYCGLVHVPYEEHFTPAVEIGWRFKSAYWGQGYATEAARACLAFGFSALDLPEILANTVPANGRSRAVMERLGMTRDEEGDFDYPLAAPDSPLRRQVLYRLTREAYAQLQDGAPRT